jgi:hypothetical protein
MRLSIASPPFRVLSTLGVTFLFVGKVTFLKNAYTIQVLIELKLYLTYNIFLTEVFFVINIKKEFCDISTERKLGEGIEISPDTLSKIQTLMPQIRTHRSTGELTCFSSEGNFIFRLASEPGLIFKMTESRGVASEQQRSEQRFANMIRAKETCEQRQFDRLIVPHAKKFEVEIEGEKKIVIAEEFFPIQQHFTKQEELYHTLPDETAEQIAHFVAETGFFDMDYRNVPMLEGREIVLIDLEGMDNARTGFFGDSWRNIRGLIKCLFSEKQIDKALAIATEHNLICSRDIKADRMVEIAVDQQLKLFHEKNGILENPRKPIQIDDLTILGLDLEEQALACYWEEEKVVTMRGAVIDLLNTINKALKKAPEGASTKGKRTILLNINNNPLHDYDNACVMLPEEKKWLRRIVDALVEKGYLFALIADNGHGYLIRA